MIQTVQFARTQRYCRRVIIAFECAQTLIFNRLIFQLGHVHVNNDMRVTLGLSIMGLHRFSDRYTFPQWGEIVTE